MLTQKRNTFSLFLWELKTPTFFWNFLTFWSCQWISGRGCKITEGTPWTCSSVHKSIWSVSILKMLIGSAGSRHLIYMIKWRILLFLLATYVILLYLMNFQILQFWVHWCICLWPFLGSIKKFYGYDYWQSNIKNYVVPNFQNKKIGKFYLLCTISKVLVLWDHTYICWFGSCIHSLV